MKKFLEWFNERTRREKILLIALVIAGIAVFAYQIYRYKEEISNLEEELRALQNLQAYYSEKRALEKKLRELQEKGVTYKYLSYEDIYKTATKHNLVILETERLQADRFFVTISEDKITLFKVLVEGKTAEGQKREEEQKEQKVAKSITVEPINLKIIGYNRNIVSFLNELEKSGLVFVVGLYTGCAGFDRLEQFKFPPKVCDVSVVDVNQYKDWICSTQGPDSFYITLLLLRAEE